MAPEEIRRGFDALAPWNTSFLINGQQYGAAETVVITAMAPIFHQRFPTARNILELGSHEGGRTFPLAHLPATERIVAVEGRADNLRRSQFAQQALGLSGIDWVEGDMETLDLTSLGHFDSVSCSWVLYHLPKPWELLERCREVSLTFCCRPTMRVRRTRQPSWMVAAEDTMVRMSPSGYPGYHHNHSG